MASKMDVSESSERSGRLLIDNSVESDRAIVYLSEAGYSVNIVPVSGTVGPELTMGSITYFGLRAIQNFIRLGNVK